MMKGNNIAITISSNQPTFSYKHGLEIKNKKVHVDFIQKCTHRYIFKFYKIKMELIKIFFMFIKHIKTL